MTVNKGNLKPRQVCRESAGCRSDPGSIPGSSTKHLLDIQNKRNIGIQVNAHLEHFFYVEILRQKIQFDLYDLPNRKNHKMAFMKTQRFFDNVQEGAWLHQKYCH